MLGDNDVTNQSPFHMETPEYEDRQNFYYLMQQVIIEAMKRGGSELAHAEDIDFMLDLINTIGERKRTIKQVA